MAGLVSDLITIQLVRTSCADCGIVFGVPQQWQVERSDDGKDFWCPNGHRLHFGGNTLRERLAAAERARDWANTSAQAARDQAEAERRSHAATKGHLTRTRKQIAAGTCPCCSKPFAHLARHMKSRHPEFVAENAPEVQP